jgi:glycosyltransferase involved in cell wall biosynthesis
VRILFYKSSFAWPRTSGDDVHTSQMIRAVVGLGAHVEIATATPPVPEALADIDVDRVVTLDECPVDGRHSEIRLRPLEERFRTYWGIPSRRIAAFARLARDIDPAAVVVAGLDALPLLAGIQRGIRIWYAGDEWTWHHLSQVRLTDARTWHHVRAAAVKGLYERTFASRLDRAWTVSEPDARSLRWISGIAHVDTIPNGVDATVFSPCPQREEPETAIFWGRLDFGPNIQALEWFVARAWPQLRARFSAARFTIAGYHPGAPVAMLAGRDGIELLPDVPDLRPVAARHAVVVLPFVSGGGVKNKLLEAAAMSKAIVASPRALCGLRGSPPLCQARTAHDWITTVSALWQNTEKRRDLGQRARDWVVHEHTWAAAGRLALESIERSLAAYALTHAGRVGEASRVP